MNERTSAPDTSATRQPSTPLLERVTGVHGASGLASHILDAIRDGELAPGDEVPSIRTLTSASGLSPGTVVRALNRLSARGLITVRQGRRAKVSAGPAVSFSAQRSTPHGVRDLTSLRPDAGLLPDMRTVIAPELYRTTDYADPRIVTELAAAVRPGLAADGIDNEHLTVTNGALDAIERICGVWLRPGDLVLVEDPCWMEGLSLLQALRLDIEPIPVDDEGMRPSELRRALAKALPSALLLTPRAQNPTGSSLTARRAAELGEILAEHPSLAVIEDEHSWGVAGAPAFTPTASVGLSSDRPARRSAPTCVSPWSPAPRAPPTWCRGGSSSAQAGSATSPSASSPNYS